MRTATDHDRGGREFSMRDVDFRIIAKAIYDHAGIVIGDHKRELVYSRLARRLRELGLPDFKAYLDRLDGALGDAERNHLINALTTNHTNFFRESHHFDYVRNHLVPYWKRRAQSDGNRKLRIWSAGCSTGEEPYTLAMTMAEAMDGLGGWDWKILATDIDTNVLNHCREGRYEREAVKSTPAQYRTKFFRSSSRDDGHMAVSASLKSHLIFNRLNLHAAWPMKVKFDAIFCRNVTIYFDADSKRTLIQRFRGMMKEDACLFLGHSESLLGDSGHLKSVGRTIYAREGDVHDGA